MFHCCASALSFRGALPTAGKRCDEDLCPIVRCVRDESWLDLNAGTATGSGLFFQSSTFKFLTMNPLDFRISKCNSPAN